MWNLTEIKTQHGREALSYHFNNADSYECNETAHVRQRGRKNRVWSKRKSGRDTICERDLERAREAVFRYKWFHLAELWTSQL